MVGARIEMADRRGKYLVFRLDTKDMLVIHLRMTGALLHRRADAPPDPFLRAVLHLDDGTELRFTDIRKFGGLWLTHDFELVHDRPGPRAAQRWLYRRYRRRRRQRPEGPVKSIILDQRRIAGIGNIYADEACFAAHIDPRRHGLTLTEGEVTALHEAVRQVLAFGVESRGASFRDYKDADGKSGSMHMHVKVFRRTGKECYDCGSVIERVVVGGRSTHFCPKCQV